MICRKCLVTLNDDNWSTPYKLHKNYICKNCKAKYDSNYRKEHQEERRSYDRQYYREHFKEQREKRRDYFKEYYRKHKEQRTHYALGWKRKNARRLAITRRKWKQEQRLKVIQHYSPNLVCQECGNSDIRTLTIDHVNNDGSKDRKTKGCGVHLARWLIRNNYPKGFQILCMNCNWCKRTKLTREKTALNAISHYSNNTMACAACGCKDMRVLSIDHIGGGGVRHLKEIGRSRFMGWLKKNHYPAGYQVLCMNCQWIKRIENSEIRRRY